MPLTQVETSGLSGSGASSNSTTGNVFSQTGPFKNKIINGAMAVDQRNAGASQTFTAGAALAYAVDRWYGYCTGANVTGQRVAGTGADQYRYRFTGASSVTAIGFAQRIEQLNSYDLNTTTATLSVDLANSLLTSVTWTAFYANTADTFGTLASPTRTQIATGTFTVTSTVTRYSASISIPAAATTGIEIVFTVGAQTSGTWTIGDVQLEAGSSATAFERRSYGQELQLCQRYAYVMRTYSAGEAYFRFPTGYTAGSSTTVTNIPYPVEMRSTPSLAANINWQEIINNSPTSPSGTSVALSSDAGNRSYGLTVFTPSSGAFTGFGALSCVRVNNSTTWSLTFSSEL
jgi:hypothetical protein